jgi:hypothetical protein
MVTKFEQDKGHELEVKKRKKKRPSKGGNQSQTL